MIRGMVKSLRNPVRSRIRWRLLTTTIIQNMKRIIIFMLITLLTSVGVYSLVQKTGYAKQHSSDVSQVSLLKNNAQPDIITIHPGQYVQFNVKDGRQHVIAQGAGDAYGEHHEHEEGGLESGKFGPTEAFKVQLKRVGIYDFHDHLHPGIHIAVIVNNK